MQRTDDELDLVDELMTIAYGSASRRRELELYLELQPDGWFVFEESGRILAAAGAIAYGTFCWLGLVATHPDARGRGLATRISAHVVAWSRSRSCSTVALDASDLGRPIYERLGFRALGSTVEMLTDPGLPGDRDGVTLLAPDDIDELLELDRAVFGGDRSRLLRAVTDDDRNACLVARTSDDALAGYLVSGATSAGPGCALDAGTARRLVRALDGGRAHRLLVPFESAYLDDVLALGTEQRRLTHMRLGNLALPGDRGRLITQMTYATG
jgi:GNAT superfamily N-acetyltransferase